MKSVTSIILAGGKGTRLFPLTQHHSKPAVPFGGKYRLIDVPISHSINSGVPRISVITQFLTVELHQHISKTYPTSLLAGCAIEVLTPQENALGEKVWFVGTADAVRKNLDHFAESSADYFLILSGDQLYNLDFQKMLAFAEQTDAALTIAALPVEKSCAKRLGILQIGARKEVTHFLEKPQNEEALQTLAMPRSLYKQLGFVQEQSAHFLASMGIYIFKKEALFSLLGEDLREDFGKHLIPTQIQKGGSFAYIHRGYWEDIGTVRSFYDANMALVQGRGGIDTYNEESPIFAQTTFLPGPIVKNAQVRSSLISDGCFIEEAKIINSIIGPRVRIGKGVVIKDSIVMGSQSRCPLQELQSIEIGAGCYLEKVILDERVGLPPHITLQNKGKVFSFVRESS